ncbi:hypothetical protein SAMN05421757_109181 [Tropicimonas sediminicola]|uniref:Uncharacterized protein n=2 Tax=Tropicimonas sediminicola TaxID=1031541 RepID=A0A239LGU9_9RHOB|nr:hypothetical protein SAMN05421757_109181 [Tropicimonas sediminicola]
MASRAAKLADVLFGNARQDPVADALLKLLPIDGSLRELRRRRYLASLAASAGEGLALRDQGYICAVAGLALDSGRTDEEILAEALRLVPLPDITVRIEVAPSVTRARLEERLSGQGRVYRFLERSPDANPGLASVFDTIEGLLEGSGRRVLRVSGACRDDLEAGVAAIRMVALEGSRPFAPGAATR